MKRSCYSQGINKCQKTRMHFDWIRGAYIRAIKIHRHNDQKSKDKKKGKQTNVRCIQSKCIAQKFKYFAGGFAVGSFGFNGNHRITTIVISINQIVFRCLCFLHLFHWRRGRMWAENKHIQKSDIRIFMHAFSLKDDRFSNSFVSLFVFMRRVNGHFSWQK